MGLDIRAYAEHELLAGEDAEEYGSIYVHHGDDWADREEGAPVGWHVAEELDDAHSSYGYYFRWRQALAAAYLGIRIPDEGDWPEPADPEDPLWKLINYADNEGVFGPPMVKRIAKRLSALDPAALQDAEAGLLADWLRVFAAAAVYDDGCVEYG